MKRILSLIIALIMVTAVFAGAVAARANRPGDTNGDGEVDNKDIVTLFRFVSGGASGSVGENCDYNGDGEIDNKDVVMLFRDISAGVKFGTEEETEAETGTAIEINNYQDLVQFANRVNSGETGLNAVLTANIDTDDYREWIPIGCDADHKYVGVFDGGCFEIIYLSNENVPSKPTCAGLFGYIGAAGVVKNIIVNNADIVSISSDASNAFYAGAVAGCNEGTLYNIRGSKNTVKSRSSGSASEDSRFYTGGLVGYNTGTITTGTVNGSGELYAVSNNSRAKYESFVGGIAGYNGGSIGNCCSDLNGNIDVESRNNVYVGGITGYNDTGATVQNCENRGSTSPSASSTVNDISVCVGGIAGYNLGAITNSVERGSGTILATYSFRQRICSYYAGAIAGNNGGVITFCSSVGESEVKALGSSSGGLAYAGGMVGYNHGTIEKSYRSGSGDISSSSSNSSYAGALAGYNDGSSARISDCYNCGNGVITAATAAGGLVGCNSGTVEYAYNCGCDDISAAMAGGVIGKNEGNENTVKNCYYDRNVCEIDGATEENNWKAIGDGSVESVTGLTTNSMTGENAIDPGNMNFEAGEESPWYPGIESDCYPHLHGFVYDTTNDIADWPPRVVYKIKNYEELKQFAEKVNAGNANVNAVLAADITCNDNNWIPIGDGSGSGNAQIRYNGTFDGCGHTITGLSCSINKSDPAESQNVYAGLFGYIDQWGTVKRIGIVNPKINADAISSNNKSAKDTDVFVGAIAGLNGGKIQQCYLSGGGTVGGIGISPGVRGINVNVGALAGKNEGTVQDCYNCGSTDVKAGFKLTDDYNKHFYVETNNRINAGGIVGYNSGSIKSCYNCSDGKITAAQSKRVVYIKESVMRVYYKEVLKSYVGAIAGSVSDYSEVKNCYFDFWRCSSDSAVGNEEFAECKLTTEDMTAGTYFPEDVENMPGLSSEIWLVKKSESGYYFYPHLKGFAYDTETTIDNWPPKVSEFEPRDPDDEAALYALTISSNKQISNSDDEGVSLAGAGKVRINEIKAGAVLQLMFIDDTQYDSNFIGWYSNGKLVTDSSVYEFIISEDVEFEFRYRDENERIIKFAADLNGKKQIWEIVTCTTNYDISFPKMNFYGFKLDGWRVSNNSTDSGTIYTEIEAKDEVATKLANGSVIITVEGVFSRTREAADPRIPGLDGKYTVTVCWNDIVVERLFRDFPASEYFTFNADEIEKYVDTTGKTFSHWLLDDVKISTNREVTFRVAKDC
ncbi:MAG: dockerin type I repeat-containing protein, partial [Clostridia bacterium]|nr:dockerin type I repeat-containing protein [Clostridia bacterium]